MELRTPNTHGPEGPLHARPEVYDRRWVVHGAMCLALLMVVMTVASVQVALPGLQTDLEVSNTVLQWIVDAYPLVFAGLLLMAGALGDRFGRKGALLGGSWPSRPARWSAAWASRPPS